MTEIDASSSSDFGFEPITQESCRFCLRSCDQSTPDFTERHIQLYRDVTDFVISTENCIPTKVCRRCDLLLQGFIIFRERAAKVEETLLQNELTIKTEKYEAPDFEDHMSSNGEFTIELKQKATTFNPSDDDESGFPDLEFPNPEPEKKQTKNDEPRIHRCGFCHFFTWDVTDMKKHKKAMHPNVWYYCDLCEDKTKLPTKVELRAHFFVAHHIAITEDLTCKICNNGKKYISKYGLNYHIEMIHNQQKVHCEICDRYFNPNSFKYHFKREHETESLVEMCQHCGKRFVLKSDLRLHIQRHHTNREGWNHKCHLCPRKFFERGALKRHLLVHNPQPQTCTVCGKSYNSRYMQLHMNTHTKDGYDCPKCGHQFAASVALRQHITAHHPEVPLPPSGTVLKHFDWESLLNPIKSEHWLKVLWEYSLLDLPYILVCKTKFCTKIWLSKPHSSYT